MALKLTRESALNLTLSGSIGSFRVGTGQQGKSSLEVKYFLTHVGLDFSRSSDEALLHHLAPVREIFDINQLDFDEIMQRDIDDARVSSELIPYLLDEKSVDLVKLFPPIVVVILPVQESQNRPADFYPEVEKYEQPGSYDETPKSVLRSGEVGKEVFQFEQPIDGDIPLKHDLVRLRLNTHKTRLVIVDGQHRAMALLALYRNLKEQWSDEKRAPFKEYYSEWTPNYIQQFNLKEINLPIILCTFPDLDKNYVGDFNLKRAARSIFLTLNKTARKVSDSRNILLNDNDIIAYFLRECLSKIKKSDARSSFSLRVHNVELDQEGDKLKIQNPIAITGVNHLYYIIEHLLLNNGNEINGVRPRSGKLYKRTDLKAFVFMHRLDGRNLLGIDIADSTKRDNFSTEVAQKLSINFAERYGDFIIYVFERLFLYENHNRAVLKLATDLESHQDRQLKPILFEGQGMSRVFESHRINLKDKSNSTKIPEIEEIIKRLDATSKRISEALNSFQIKRAELCLNNVNDKVELKGKDGKFSFEIIKWFNVFYENTLKTVAFQSALICGFFGELEKIEGEYYAFNVNEAFDEYINQINYFFTPTSSSHFKKIVKIFTGELKSNGDKFRIIENSNTFREIVYPGEMQPDQWPKYKYLLLEIWKPTYPLLSESINKEIRKCRKQIFSALHNKYKADYCKERSKLSDNLNEAESKEIFDTAILAYNNFLKNLGSDKLNEDDMKSAISTVPATEVNEYDLEE